MGKKIMNKNIPIKQMFIKIYGVSDIATFVANALQVNGDVIVKINKFIVNGKSLKGMFAIEPSEGITVEYPANAIAFEEFLKQFKAE